MTKNNNVAAADVAMNLIWAKWFSFYQAHFRAGGVAISAADQMAFYEIAQPILRELVSASEQPPVQDKPITRAELVDALGCFWNAALNHAHANQSTTLAFDTVGAIVEGVQAVANRLEEQGKSHVA